MIDQRAVYIYKWPHEKDFGGLALDVHMHKGELRFFDTGRGHQTPGEIIKETDQGFIFRSEGHAPGEWEFKILTIQDFKKRYYKIVTNGEVIAAKIKTTEDLHYWYRREFRI